MEKLIITAAICGAEVTKEQNPAVPYTVEEMVREAKSAYEAGAAILHIHVREDDGTPTQGRERFRVVMDAIRKELLIRLEAIKAAGIAVEAVEAYENGWKKTETSRIVTDALIAALEQAEQTEDVKYVLENKEYLAKKSVWAVGGDGWAYDIGYGGIDHVMAQNRDVNLMVLDTEVYSNTGGQSSKATPTGAMAQFAANGKMNRKKDLGLMAMSYGNVYVAQIAMGANPAQTIKAITEAEAYHGPSLIIGYSPCEMHSIKGGMTNCQGEMKKAVECGYWNLFRFNPAAETDKFIVDSKEPKEEGYRAFLMNEARYSRLTREFPDRAETLFKRNEEVAMDRYQHLLKLKAMYDEK